MQYVRMLTNSMLAGALVGAYVALLVLQLNPTVQLNSMAVARLVLTWLAFYGVHATAFFYGLTVLRQLLAVEVRSPGWVSLRLLAAFGTIAVSMSALVTWLRRTDVPLMVSHRQLAGRRTFPRALGPWVLDSGAYSELSLHGAWEASADEYAAAVRRYAEEVGGLVWAAPQDWLCIPSILARTGLTVAEHQARTVRSFVELDGRGPFIPVLQGDTPDDYLRCADAYERAGVDLGARPLVGLGSIVRRAHEAPTVDLIRELHARGYRLHGFGIKRRAIGVGGYLFDSGDSHAWSYRARRMDGPLPGCTHRSCNNCLRFALLWREETLRRLESQQLHLPLTGRKEIQEIALDG